MRTAPHAHAQNDWKCCFRHKKTARYGPKSAPRNRKALVDFVEYASKLNKLLYKKQIGTHRQKKHVLTLTLMLMLVRGNSACKTSAGSSKIFRWLTQFDPILRSIFGPKNKVSYGRISLLPQMFCTQICDPAAWTWMSIHIFFSLCVPSPVATTVEVSLSPPGFDHFFGSPCLRAMMKQVCWHLRRFEAHRGLLEAGPRTQNVL